MQRLWEILIIFGITWIPAWTSPAPPPDPPPPALPIPPIGVSSSNQTVCPSDFLKVDEKFCMWASDSALSWNDALASCHEKQSHLLILDQGYYRGSTSTKVLSGIVGLLSNCPGLDVIWTGLHVLIDKRRDRERLWWEADVPLAGRCLSSNDKPTPDAMCRWSDGQPNTTAGLCGAVKGLLTTALNPPNPQQPPLVLGLDECQAQKQFICVREVFIPKLKINSTGCPVGWMGDPDLPVCYKGTSGSSTSSFDIARSACRWYNSQLAFPKNNTLVQFFMELFTSAVQAPPNLVDVWIGTNMSKTDANAFLAYLPAQMCPSNGVKYSSMVCLYLRIGQNREYSFCYDDCTTGTPKNYICEVNATLAGAPKAEVAQRNVSLSFKVNATAVGLNCVASNYHPSKDIVWVKDGVYFGNGLPPSGLTLYLNETDVLTKLGLTRKESLQGEYHCEVWGQRSEFRRVPGPGDKIQSALVTANEDVGTFRGTINFCFGSSDQVNQILSKFFGDRVPGIYLEVDGLKRLSGFSYDFVAYYRYNVTDLSALQTLVDHLKASQSGFTWQNLMNEKVYQLLTGGVDELLVQYNGTNQEIEAVEFLRTDVCAEGTVNGSTFNSAHFGSLSNSIQLCPLDLDTSKAVGQCSGDFIVGGSWSIVSSAECKVPPTASVPSLLTRVLREISQTPINSSNVDKVLESTAKVTSLTDRLTQVDIAYTAEILNNVATRNDIPKSVAREFLQTVSNIAAAPSAQLSAADSAVKKIVTVLEKFTDNVDLQDSANLSLSTPNVALQVCDTTNDQKVYGFVSYRSSFDTRMQTYLTSSSPTSEDLYMDIVEGAIVLSDEAIEMASREQVMLREALGWKEKLRVSFIIYRDGSLFSDPAFMKLDNGARLADKTENISVNSYVISGIINRQTIENLTDPVKIILKPIKRHAKNESSACAYWEHDVTSGLWGWSTRDVWSNWSNDSSVWYCFSRHLTNFAIIAGFDGPPDSPVAIALRTLSIIGISLSIIGLSLTIIAQILFKALAKGRSQLVLMNLAIALLSVDILVLVGVDRTDNYEGCIVVAALLLYFLLVSFCWMLIEGVIQYLKFVKVFDTYTPRFMLKSALPAWGVPLIPVIIVAAVDYRQFRGPENYCWLAPNAFHFAFLLPLGLIWLTNLVLFILIIKGITCDRPKGLQSTQKRTALVALQVQAAVCCTVVMGLTWLFCLLSVNGSVIAMDFLFCIFNSLQGFFIFLFLNIREKPIRVAWLKLFRRCCSLCCHRRKTTVTKMVILDNNTKSKKWSTATTSSENQESSSDSGYDRSMSSSSSERSSASTNSLGYSSVESKLCGMAVITHQESENYNY